MEFTKDTVYCSVLLFVAATNSNFTIFVGRMLALDASVGTVLQMYPDSVALNGSFIVLYGSKSSFSTELKAVSPVIDGHRPAGVMRPVYCGSSPPVAECADDADIVGPDFIRTHLPCLSMSLTLISNFGAFSPTR